MKLGKVTFGLKLGCNCALWGGVLTYILSFLPFSTHPKCYPHMFHPSLLKLFEEEVADQILFLKVQYVSQKKMLLLDN